jgi:DNA-binding response OmpR family regulator
MAKILIADADGDESALIAFALRFAGHHVMVVGNTHDAIDQTDQFKPDLIVLEAGMPGLNESDAWHGLASKEAGTGKPCILLVEQEEETDLKQGLKSTVHYLVKPISPDALIKQVNSVLKRMGK